jgi:hypothetical protein
MNFYFSFIFVDANEFAYLLEERCGVLQPCLAQLRHAQQLVPPLKHRRFASLRMCSTKPVRLGCWKFKVQVEQ